MALLRSLGALAFVLGVALLTLDAARSLKARDFATTSLERLWINLGGDGLFRLRFHFEDWFGPVADQILDLPAAFLAFGLGMALLLFADGAQRGEPQKPLMF